MQSYNKKFLDKILQVPVFRALYLEGVVPHNEETPIYKYTSFESAVKILTTCKFRFSAPILFNDPFDMSLDFLNVEIDLEKKREEGIQHILKTIPNSDPEKARIHLARYSKDFFLDHYKEKHKRMREEVLILCSSKKNNDTLLWSHYADKHKGICIGFRMKLIDAAPKLLTMNVNYTNKINPLNIVTDNDLDTTVAFWHWVATKSHIWSYEQEVRSIILNPDYHEVARETHFADFEIDRSLICEIYYGLGVTDPQIKEVEKIISARNYKIEKRGKMKLEKETFALAIESL